MSESFRCYLVRKVSDRIEAGPQVRPLRELPPGDVLIRVAYSSLNYKDAMGASGHPGIAKSFPHVPGVDAAGSVFEADAELQVSSEHVGGRGGLGVLSHQCAVHVVSTETREAGALLAEGRISISVPRE